MRFESDSGFGYLLNKADRKKRTNKNKIWEDSLEAAVNIGGNANDIKSNKYLTSERRKIPQKGTNLLSRAQIGIYSVWFKLVRGVCHQQ